MSHFHYSHPSECEMVSPVVLICISLMANDIKHLFMCLLAVCVSSLENCLFRSFLYMVWGRAPNSLFYMWTSSCPCTIYQKRLFFPPLSCLGNLVENQLTMDIRVYLWSDSVPFMFMSTFMPVPQHLDYSFIVRFVIGKTFSRLFWLFWIPWIFILILGWAC